MRGDGEKLPLIQNGSVVMEMEVSGSVSQSRDAASCQKGESGETGSGAETAGSSSDSAESNGDSQSSTWTSSLTTTTASLMNILRGFCGPGMLGQPSAVRNAGLAVGTVGILLIGALTTHCMHILVRGSNIICKRTGRKALTYAEVAEFALATGPSRTRRFAPALRWTITGFVTMTQFGILSIFISFVSENVQQVMDVAIPDVSLSLSVYKSLVALLLIPMVMVRNLRLLAPFSAITNIFTVFSIVVVFVYILPGLPDVSERPLAAPLSRLPLFIGTAVYSFEGICLVLPIKNKMETPEDYRGCTGVLNLAMVINMCANAGLGFYGYLKFGDDVKGSITLNLPSDDSLCLTIKMLVAVAIWTSYSVQLYVLVHALWPFMASRFQTESSKLWGERAFRIAIVLATYTLAVVVPYLELLLSLVGALFGMALAFGFPTLIELLALQGMEPGELPPEDVCVSCRPYSTCCTPPQPEHHRLVKIKAAAILTFAVLGGVAGTYTSIVSIAQAFTE